MAFIPNIETIYEQPFLIKNFNLIFENDFSNSSVAINASSFGLEDSIPLISGSLKQNKILHVQIGSVFLLTLTKQRFHICYFYILDKFYLFETIYQDIFYV